MKKTFWILLLFPFSVSAQETLPRFEQDTLYTSTGYKIYKGQILQLAKGSSAAGYFNYIKFHPNLARTDTYVLQNSSILVNKLKSYKYNGPDKNSIRIAGTATLKNGSTMEVDLVMNFERVIESFTGLPGEITVPEEYKNKLYQAPVPVTNDQKQPEVLKNQAAPEDLKQLMVADEIKKLFDLYKAGALTKVEYEAQKKKLLDRQ